MIEHARFSKCVEIELKCRVNIECSEFFYHGTQERHMESIRENGLSSDMTLEQNYDISKPNSVYLTTDRHLAECFAKWNIGYGKEKAFILKIPKSAIPLDKLKIDENLEYDGQNFRLEDITIRDFEIIEVTPETDFKGVPY